MLRYKALIPVEIKYQNQIFPSDLKSLLKFMENSISRGGIVVTKNPLERRFRFIDKKEITLLPAWLFLYVN